MNYATPVAGSYQCAYADFTLSGTLAAGDYVGLAYLGTHYTYQFDSSPHILEDAVQAITDAINARPIPAVAPTLLMATRAGTTIRVYYTGGPDVADSTAGANGNRFAMYFLLDGRRELGCSAKTFANGTSPTQWQVTLDFSSLLGTIDQRSNASACPDQCDPKNALDVCGGSSAGNIRAQRV